MIAWIAFYFIETLLLLWLIRWGGAQRLEGSLKAIFFVEILIPSKAESVLTAENIKIFAWLGLILSSIWFIIGIFSPSWRFI